MRVLAEIVRFETRFQFRSTLYLALLASIAFLHFSAARKWGIDIGIGAARDVETLPLNSAIAVIQNELVLSLFSVFPGLALAATAITRDHERRTAELFFSLPIRPGTFARGRFAGAFALSLLIGLVGLLASFISLLTPGIDPLRLMPFAAGPWVYTFFVIVMPNVFITSALIFSAAAWTRSMAGAYCAALVLPVLPMLGIAQTEQSGFAWLDYVDPFGAAAIANTTRYWTGPELLVGLPGEAVLLNRLFWLALSGGILAISIAGYRFSLSGKRRTRDRKAPLAAFALPEPSDVNVEPRFGGFATLAQFASQLRIDLRATLVSPPFLLILGLVVFSCVQEFNAPSSLAYSLPVLPLTSRFIGYLDVGLALPLILAVAYYSGLLVHRERQCRLAEIVDASPLATATSVTSKIAALLVMVSTLLGAAIATFVALQLASGFSPVELDLYFKGLLVYGANHYLLIVPAVLIHLVFSNRWVGMLAFFTVLFAAYSLPAFGLGNVLYNFRMMAPIYSDMNGFGHFVVRQASLTAYWSAFVALLALVAIVVAQRGTQEDLRARLAEARGRATRSVRLAALSLLLLFGSIGSWIYYNTHILNRYVSGREIERLAAQYEKDYRKFADLRTPVSTDVDISLEMFPSERRIESSGAMRLANDGTRPISELFLSFNPELRVDRLILEGAELIERDDLQGVRRYRLEQPLRPGAEFDLEWRFSWLNEGFANVPTSNEITFNGINLEAKQVLPTFGYDDDRELDDPFVRARFGLPPVHPLPSLDDPAARNDTNYNFVFANFHAVIGTAADQTALTSGTLVRQWREGGRKYFEYEGRFPPYVPFASARYEIARETVDGVTLEIFYDPKHREAVQPIMNSLKLALGYYSEQFTPYFADTFKIFEYPRYSTRVHAMLAAVSFNEDAAFSQKFAPGQVDIITGHEFGHMWWGGQVRSPRVQGQEVLNEGLASYASFMLVEHGEGRAAVRHYLDITRDNYLDSYSRVGLLARPVIRAETGLDTYGKASLVMYTLRDAIGADAVNGALQQFLVKYGMRPPPYPTTLELVAELRAAAAPEYQQLISDLFEKITFYDVSVKSANVRRLGGGYEVAIEIDAAKRHANSDGSESEAPLRAPFDIAVFGEDDETPLYLHKHWLESGTRRIVVTVKGKPERVAVDPFGMMIDRRPDDNSLKL